MYLLFPGMKSIWVDLGQTTWKEIIKSPPPFSCLTWSSTQLLFFIKESFVVWACGGNNQTTGKVWFHHWFALDSLLCIWILTITLRLTLCSVSFLETSACFWAWLNCCWAVVLFTVDTCSWVWCWIMFTLLLFHWISALAPCHFSHHFQESSALLSWLYCFLHVISPSYFICQSSTIGPVCWIVLYLCRMLPSLCKPLYCPL